MNPELKKFLLHLLANKDDVAKQILGTENFAAYVNANFIKSFYSSFEFLIAVKKITDPTENLRELGQYTGDPEEFANVTPEQQAASVLLFIEHCYKKLLSTPAPTKSKYKTVLRFFAEKLRTEHELSQTIQNTYPNFIKIIRYCDNLTDANNKDENQSIEATAEKEELNQEQNTSSVPNVNLHDVAEAAENAKDPAATVKSQPELNTLYKELDILLRPELNILYKELDILLRQNTKSFFGLLVNDPSNNKKNPNLYALLEFLRNAKDNFTLKKIQELSDLTFKYFIDSNPAEREVYLEINALILKKIKGATATYNSIRVNLYKLNALNHIGKYTQDREGTNKYIFNDLYYRAPNDDQNEAVPKDSQKYKTAYLFGDIADLICKANDAQTLLNIIQKIQDELKPFYDLSNSRFHNQTSASKTILHNLQEQTLAILKATYPNATNIIKKAELLVDNAYFAKLQAELFEYKNARQSITSNPFSLVKDKITDTQRIQFFNYTDWLLTILETISKNIETAPEKIADLPNKEKIQLYFQYIEASAYVLKQIKGKDNDFENALLNNQYSIIRKLVELIATEKNPVVQQQYQQKLLDILDYQNPNGAAARKIHNLFKEFNLRPFKRENTFTKTFPATFAEEMSQRYKSWQAVENLRRNQIKSTIFANYLIEHLSNGIGKLAKGKSLDSSIFEKIANGVSVVIPTPEVKFSIKALGMLYDGYKKLNPDIHGDNYLKTLKNEHKEGLITILVEMFLEIYQQKICMLHFDTSNKGRDELNRMASYAADRILHILERNNLNNNQANRDAAVERQLVSARRYKDSQNKDLPEYITNSLDKVFEDLQSTPFSHYDVPGAHIVHDRTTRTQNEGNMKVDSFFRGGKTIIQENHSLKRKPPRQVSMFSNSNARPVPTPKIFLGYFCHFWNAPAAQKTAQNKPEAQESAPSPGLSR